MRSFWPAERYLGWLLPLVAVVAEGALVAVVYVAVEVAVDHRVPLLGTFEFSVAAGVSALVARRRWIDPDEDAVRFLGFLAVLGVIGWIWDADVRRLVLAGDPLGAVPIHPGGWLTVAAAMRGVGRAFEVDDRAATRLVLIGVPALAIPWAIGQIGAAELRDVFVRDAFETSITFVTAGFISAGLARLAEIGRETGVDWRQNRSWLGTVFGVIGVVLVIGLPASILLGLPGDALARGILGPIVSLIGYVIVAGFALAALVAVALSGILRSLGLRLPPPGGDDLPQLPNMRTLTLDELREPLTALIAVWVVIIVVLVVLARIWLRRRGRRDPRVGGDQRRIQIPQRARHDREPATRASRAPGWTRPFDAVTAYLAALRDLAARRPDAARAEHETPRGHARRIEADAELVALQADYALVRYGNRQLSAAEHRRALARWRRFRARIDQGPDARETAG